MKKSTELKIGCCDWLLAANAQCSNYNSNGYCYYLVRGPASWTQAQAYCGQTGSTLVGIYNTTIQNQVRQLLDQQQFSGKVWTGAREEESNDMIGYPTPLWRWVKGRPSPKLMTSSWTFWGEGNMMKGNKEFYYV